MIRFGDGSAGYPGPFGPFDFYEDTFTPSGGQIGDSTPTFTLTFIPVDIQAVIVFVNGKAETNLSITGKNLTIILPTYTLDASDEVRVEYPYIT